MLSLLHIENIAVIECADISFDAGFNVLTGETGAGKSLIIDSLALLLGEKADKSLISYGKDYASVEAVFTTNSEQILSKNGFSYGATAKLTAERFPTRVYGEYTLPAGEYTALILELGKGQGDNWWCVVYPPLCFAKPTGGNVVYKSKILEIIENWKNG